jgi:hypothetical protein
MRLSQQSGGTDGRIRPGTVATSKQPFKKPATEKRLPPLPKSTRGAYKRLRKLWVLLAGPGLWGLIEKILELACNVDL